MLRKNIDNDIMNTWTIPWYLFLPLTLLCSRGVGDWLNCAHITVCRCKWSSGKKTANCLAGNLTDPPQLSPDIQFLDLQSNRIASLKENAFSGIGLINLQKIILKDSKIKIINENAFSELNILIEVDLSDNILPHLPNKLFHGNNRLRLIILNGNPLGILGPDQFINLPHLRKVELRNCELRLIHPSAFRNLNALESVDLSQNKLKFLHIDTFNRANMKTLRLTDNIWHCDCQLKFFHEWFLQNNFGNEHLICNSPDIHKKKSWRVISANDMICEAKLNVSSRTIRTEPGMQVQFGCCVSGDPIPKVEWTFNFTSNNIALRDLIQEVNESFETAEDYGQRTLIEWRNITIMNVSHEFAGDWICSAKTVSTFLNKTVTVILLRSRDTKNETFPYSIPSLTIVIASVVLLMTLGFIGTCTCFCIQKKRLLINRNFVEQEKKLLDTSTLGSCNRSSIELAPYGLEMSERPLSISDIQRCSDPLYIKLNEGQIAYLPPPPEFSMPTNYENIFISVRVDEDNKYPDLLDGRATLPRKNSTFCPSKRGRASLSRASSFALSLTSKNSEDDKSNQVFELSSTEFTSL